MRYKITIAYDGTGFFGWQVQNDKRTVQGEVEKALKQIYGIDIRAVGAGRTDEGVHALGQVAHFDADDKIETTKIPLALNYYLPKEIRVLDCKKVDEYFNARKSAKRKTYTYDIALGKENPLLMNKATFVHKRLDVEKMQDAATVFVGEKNFIAFRAKGSSSTTTVRKVEQCFFTTFSFYGSAILRFTITANGFLYKMVRMIVAALIKVGEGSLSKSDIEKSLLSNSEAENKPVAPPQGLYLCNVEH